MAQLYQGAVKPHDGRGPHQEDRAHDERHRRGGGVGVHHLLVDEQAGAVEDAQDADDGRLPGGYLAQEWVRQLPQARDDDQG